MTSVFFKSCFLSFNKAFFCHGGLSKHITDILCQFYPSYFLLFACWGGSKCCDVIKKQKSSIMTYNVPFALTLDFATAH